MLRIPGKVARAPPSRLKKEEKSNPFEMDSINKILPVGRGQITDWTPLSLLWALGLTGRKEGGREGRRRKNI